MPDPTRVGFICSSGGGVLDAMSSLRERGFGYDVTAVVTDRPCGAEAVAGRHAIPLRRVVEPDRERFSTIAATHLRAGRVDVTVLLFTRLVGPALWRDELGVVWNLHPSLLPRHRGLGALARSHAAARAGQPAGAARPLGVTLHRVTGDADAGPIIGQGRFGLDHAATLEAAGHVCFLLKLALLLEAIASGAHRGTPPIAERVWRGAFRGLVPRPAVLDAIADRAKPPATAWLRSCAETVTR